MNFINQTRSFEVVCGLVFFLLVFRADVLFGQASELEQLIESYQDAKSVRDTFGWSDRSMQALEDQKNKFTDLWQELEQINESDLELQDRISYDLLKIVLWDDKFGADWGESFLLLNAEGGFLTELIYTFGNLRIEDEDDFEAYLNRLKGIPTFLHHGEQLLLKGIEEGKMRPKIIVEKCISLMDYHLAKSIEESLFYQPISSGSELQKNQAEVHIKHIVLPAYRAFKRFLESTYSIAAPQKPGISYVSDGADFYKHKVNFYTTLSMSPDEVFETGHKEVRRIREEMNGIIADLNFERSFEEFLAFLRTDAQFYAPTPEALLEKAAWISKDIEAQLPRFFNKLPRNPFTVRPVPAALAPNYTGGRYSPGSLKNRRAGEYWVNTYDLPSRPLYVLPALTLHEAVPGHHLQGSLAQEIELSPFRRGTYLSAFGEGWALYGEYLGKEMGIYKNPYEQFGRLTYEMWRACRLVVDTGIHAKGWTRQQVVDYMAGNTALSLHEVNTETDRYISWPGQALSYKIGELKIRELRQKAEAELGEDFDIRQFHEVILEQGTVTLSILEDRINNYIQQTASSDE